MDYNCSSESVDYFISKSSFSDYSSDSESVVEVEVSSSLDVYPSESVVFEALWAYTFKFFYYTFYSSEGWSSDLSEVSSLLDDETLSFSSTSSADLIFYSFLGLSDYTLTYSGFFMFLSDYLSEVKSSS